METKNCPKCGRLFTHIRDPLCPECTKEEELTFQKVRAYLKEFPGDSIAKVSRETGVSTRKINKYLREGRLEVSDGLSDFLTCMSCGKPIPTGKFCRDCSSRLSKGMGISSSTEESKNDRNGPRMHHLR